MRIISNGIDFDLPTGFAAELSRYNVLLSDAGEQTAPITLPGTPKNLQLVGYSDRIDNVYKPLTDLDVTVIDGLFHRQCNLGIHTANAVDGISCTIYLGTGEFYSKVGDSMLNSLNWPVVTDTVLNLIALLRNEYLSPSEDTIFRVVPVATSKSFTWIAHKLMPNNSYQDINITGLFILNGFEKYQHLISLSDNEATLSKFEAEYIQRMIVDEATVTIQKGYGMTPFLKLKYVIEFIFSDYGYTLNIDNLTTSFPKLANEIMIINNVADAIYSGVLRYSQLVPYVKIKDFISEFEKLFGGKFAIDEIKRTVSFKFFNEQLVLAPDIDLTAYLCSNIKPLAPEFTIVKIVDNSNTSATNDTDTKDKVETIGFNTIKTVYVEDEYNAWEVTNNELTISLGLCSIDYISHKNSAIQINSKTITEEDNKDTNILFLSATMGWNQAGSSQSKTIICRRSVNQLMDVSVTSLYTAYKEFKLNSNIPIEAEMNIPASELERMDLHVPKILHGQPVMIESIKYALGKNGTQAVTMRTLRKYEER